MKLVLKHNDTLKAFLLLGLIIIVVYFPITFLGHSNDTSYNAAVYPRLDWIRDFGCTTECGGPYNFTIDPGASGDAIWPVIKLASELYLQGIVPLWNPYLAAGTPLAADSLNFVFSPLMVFYLLPNSFWDVPLLISVWLAGIFTYLLLRSWKLGFLSSLSGSTIFMLSGAITWYLPHDSIPVIIFAPLILFSIEKVIQSRNSKYLILGSVAIAFSILGAHVESIVLVLLLCSVYSIFRILYRVFSKSNKQITQGEVQRSGGLIILNNKKLILKLSMIFFAGLGLSAFFILPTTEYLIGGTVGRSSNVVGLTANPPFTIATTFLPYLLGPIHVYVNPATGFVGSWNALGGYVAASSLIFSLIGITFSSNSSLSTLQRFIPRFFFGISIFFVLKSIGFPVINMLGALPILDHVVFPRYDAFIWTLGFAISTAFGIEVLVSRRIGIKHLTAVTLVSFLVILSMAALIIPYLTWQTLSGYYMIFQILEGLFFILSAFFLIISSQRGNNTVSRLFFLIFLELSLYIPMSLPPVWQFYRSVAVILGVAALCLVSFLPLEKLGNFMKENKIKMLIFVIIVSITLIAQLFVYLESPQGLRLRDNAFESTPLTEFLKNNVGYSRIFSFHTAFLPNFPAAYQIQTLGILSAFNVNWFNSFVHNILDPYALITHFDYHPSWRVPDSPSLEYLFVENKKYYDFLGVKYIVSYDNDPNMMMFGPSGGDTNILLDSPDKSIEQEFKSTLDNITSLSIQLATYNQKNQGKVILTIDSIPYNETYHRETIVNAEDLVDNAFQSFQIEPLNGVKDKSFNLSLKFFPSNTKSTIAVYFYNGHQSYPSLDIIKSLGAGQLKLNGSPSNGILAFSINSNMFNHVFQFKNFNIYENPAAFPRTFLVEKYTVVEPAKAQDFLLKHPDFDLRNNVIIEKLLPSDQIDLLKSCTLNKNSNTNIVSYSANKVAINTSSDCLSLLVLTDVYYPGWKATIDGNESHIYRADGLVRAIVVPQGNHTIVFSYLPPSFVIGLTITIITAGILIGFFVYSKRKEQINGHIQSP